MRLTPGPNLPLLLIPPLLCAVLADLWLAGPWMFLLALALTALPALVDLLRLQRCQPEIRVERRLCRSLPLNVWSGFGISLVNAGPGGFTAQLADRWPAGIELAPEDFSLSLAPGHKVAISCRIRPGQRGDFELAGLDALVLSPWRLWRQSRLLPCPDRVRVFPNFRELHRYTLLARSAQLGLMGIRQAALHGEGQEFQQLRAYNPGDPLRLIDWKATSRLQRLISREYQEERDQNVVLALDCSRRMRHRGRGLCLFDQALNSALLLAHVAARQGDSVGFMAAGDTILWQPPGKKAGATRSLLLASTRLFPETVAADYQALARELATRLKRRSLVILLTNSRAEDYERLEELARQLGRRHLLVIGDLMEQEVADCLRQEPRGPDEALRWQALLAYSRARRRFALQLGRQGCLSLDCTAAELPPLLVNTYLDIKRRKRL